jgi:hypothetical protein
MPTDIIMEILEDGTVSVKTSDVAEQHHLSADQLLEELDDLLGGEVAKRRREHPLLKNKRVLRGGKIVHAEGGR